MKNKILCTFMAVCIILSTFTGMVIGAENYNSVSQSYLNGHTYLLFDNSVTWKEAQEYCNSIGGYLATITSQEENNVLYNLIKKGSNTDYFIGSNDSEKEGVWKWITNEPMNYTNWNAGEPNDTNNEDFASIIKTNGKWNDLDASAKRGFICEIPKTMTYPKAQTVWQGHTYHLYDNVNTWEEAKEICESIGGHLATITSQEEDNVLYNLIKKGSNTDYFIGSNDSEKEGVWKWITNEPMNYTNWNAGEPNNLNNEDFASLIKTNGEWNDLDASAKRGFICEWDNGNIGTSTSQYTSIAAPVYSTEQQEILDDLKVDTDELLQNISCGNHPIKGPSVTFLGKTFYLFEFDGKLNFKFKNLNVQAKVDADNKTIQFLVGYKIFSESANLGNDYNNSSYWSQSYQQVKSLYKGVTGKNVDTTKLWNQFSSIRGQLKEFDSDLLVDAKCKVAGFLELSYETGSAKFSEGGFLMEASIGGEFVGRVPAFPPAYVVLGLEASLEGKIFVAYEQYISINSELNAALAANVGVGLGSKKAKTYLEGGLTGELGAKMLAVSGSFKDYTTDFDPLTVTIKGEIYLKGSFLGFLNGEKNWPIGEPVQLYPKNDISLMSYALFDENTIDDVIANSTPLSREYLYDVMLMSIDDSDKLYSDKSIYSYNAPVLTTLSDGSMLLLWVDDLGTKNDINKTSLMYSIYNGEAWSEANELFETGTYNGAPTIYNDGEKVHIIWSKAKTVFADDAGLEDLIIDSELNYTSYANGEFTEPVVLTENSLFEINYDIIENNGKIAVAWSENNENDPYMTSGTNSLYMREYKEGSWSEKKLVSQSDNAIDEIELYYVDDVVNCVYTLVDADHSTSVYNNSDMLSDGGYLNYYNGVLYYLSDSKIMAYEVVSDMLSETGLDSVNNFSIYDGNAYSLVSNGFACELYESICADGVFSEWEQVTEFDKYIRDYSVTTDSLGEPVYALNLVEINEGENIYGASELAVCKASDINALEVTAVYYDETNVAPSTSLPLNIDVTNVGTTDVSSLNISITDNDGSILSSGIVNTEIASGESATIVYNYTLPSELELYDITVTVTSGENERNLDNNSIKTSIGYADIIVQDVVVERTENGAVASGAIYNAGYSDATNVVLSIYDASYPDEVLATIECADIASGEAYGFTYDIPEKYLSLEDKMTMYGLNFEAGSDSEELNYANNTEKVVFGELTDYTVAFVDGNQLLDIVSVEEFESYSVDKEGYTLEGWYTSSTLNADSKITTIPTDISENLIVFAKWIPMAINKAEYADKSINVKATVSEELLSESGIIVLAIYQNDKMVSMHSMDITSSIDYSFNDISEADNYNIKMFCWNGLDNLKPLCGAICADVK